MSNIPLARKQLLALALRMEVLGQRATEIAKEIRETEALMHKNFAKQKAPAQSAPMTPEMADAIRNYAALHPTASQQEIAGVFNVNPGRISEALSRASSTLVLVGRSTKKEAAQ